MALLTGLHSSWGRNGSQFGNHRLMGSCKDPFRPMWNFICYLKLLGEIAWRSEYVVSCILMTHSSMFPFPLRQKKVSESELCHGEGLGVS